MLCTWFLQGALWGRQEGLMERAEMCAGRESVKKVLALKRSVYLIMLGLGSVAGWLVFFLYVGNGFERLASFSAVASWTLLNILLWWKPSALRFVELSIISVLSILFLSTLTNGFYFQSDSYDPLNFVILAPVLYVCAFLVFGTRLGLLVSLSYYLACVGLSLGYLGLDVGALGGKRAADFGVFSRFYVGSIAYIGFLFAFAYYLERHLRARTEAEAVSHYAYTDTLTGLPNRLLFHDRLEQVMARAKRSGERFTLFFIDLDRFKLVNDTLGHQAGDTLLQQLALRLQSCTREPDTLARISGDEFALITGDLKGSQAAVTVAEKLIAALQAPFDIEGQPLFATASIGVSLYPEHGESTEELLNRADQAMYHAKASGRNSYQLYSESARAESFESHTLEQELQGAFERGELELHYQPIYELGSGKMTGFEALLRWHHARHGLVPPDVFIPLAEASRLIVPLGAWVLSEACRQNRAWQEAGFPPMVVAVNVSSVQFAKADFTRTVTQALEHSGLEARWLELELTESMVLHEAALPRLAELRALGVRISLDDFGTGYSSLSHLQQLPINGFKIDRSFIQRVGETPMPVENGLVLVKTIMALARALGLRVVAEGIETGEQLAALRDTGCDQVQGFLLTKPLPAGEIAKLLDAQQEHGVLVG